MLYLITWRQIEITDSSLVLFERSLANSMQIDLVAV